MVSLARHTSGTDLSENFRRAVYGHPVHVNHMTTIKYHNFVFIVINSSGTVFLKRTDPLETTVTPPFHRRDTSSLIFSEPKSVSTSCVFLCYRHIQHCSGALFMSGVCVKTSKQQHKQAQTNTLAQ